MGSWNSTCMLTHLPIKSGEKVTGVLLVKKDEPRVTSLPNEVWTPVSPFITGVYNDYGSIEPDGDNGDALHKRYQTLMAARKITFFDGHKQMNEIPSISELLNMAAYGSCLRLSWDGCPLGLFRLERKPPRVVLAMMKYQFYEQALASTADLVDFFQTDLAEVVPTWGGAFSAPHTIIKWLHREGEDIIPVLALNGFLGRMRMQWEPQSGAGNADSITDEKVCEFYEAVAKEARKIYERGVKSDV